MPVALCSFRREEFLVEDKTQSEKILIHLRQISIMNPNYTKLNKYLLRGSETKIAITYKADRNKFLVK